MRVRLTALSVFLAACGSGGTGATPEPAPEAAPVITSIVESGQQLGGTYASAPIAGHIVSHPTVSNDVVIAPAPLDRTWQLLAIVFDSLGIKKPGIDNMVHTIGVTEMPIRRRLGNTNLAKLLDCGSTQGSPNADSYEVKLTVMTHAVAVANGTQVATSVSGLARPLTLSDDYHTCSSTGLLEKNVAAMLDKLLK